MADSQRKSIRANGYDEKVPNKPLADLLLVTTHLNLCELHDHEGKRFIHFCLPKFMRFCQAISFDHFITLLQWYLDLMRGIVGVYVENFEMIKRIGVF